MDCPKLDTGANRGGANAIENQPNKHAGYHAEPAENYALDKHAGYHAGPSDNCAPDEHAGYRAGPGHYWESNSNSQIGDCGH